MGGSQINKSPVNIEVQSSWRNLSDSGALVLIYGWEFQSWIF